MYQKMYFILKHASPHTCGLFFLEEVNGLSSPYTIVNTIHFQENTTKGLAWVRFAEAKFSAMHWGGLFHRKRTCTALGLELSGRWLNKQCAPLSCPTAALLSTATSRTPRTRDRKAGASVLQFLTWSTVPLDKWFLDCSSYGQNVTGRRPTLPDADDLLWEDPERHILLSASLL